VSEPTRRTEVGGVPVLLAAGGGGPMRAGLVFRVGRADETPATGGVTHLVEHLALYRQGGLDHDINGMTGLTTTQFVTQGSPEAVTAFLHAVCAGLRALPLDRLDVERQILRTEADHRSESIALPLSIYRYGARDYGMAGLPEWGTHSLTAANVAEWARTWFTRANAALWIVGDDLPPGLRIDLPEGMRRPLPAESSGLPVTPAWFAGSEAAIVMDSPLPRIPAATVYTRLLEHNLFRELRQERGLSYVATAAYSTDGRTQGRLTAVADGRPDQLGAVLDGFVAEVRRLAADDVDSNDLELIRDRVLAELDGAEVEEALLPRRATDLLCGFASRTTEELKAGFRALTAADVRSVAAEVERSALLMTPRLGFGPPAGFEPAPIWSRFAVTGSRHRSRAEPDTHIVLGTDGVSIVRPRGPSTVLFAECVALLRFPDGGRHLLGPDAVAVVLEPTLYPLPRDAQDRIDAAVPQATHVDLPAREPDQIPCPKRAGGLTVRVRATAVPVRMRLDRFVMLRGGTRNVLIAVTLLLAGIVSAALAIRLHVSLLGWFAAAQFAILLRRRRKSGHG
jgi:zinc protease